MENTRFALRQVRKNPGFTAVAVLTLALGIGATTGLFSLARALVLDPFPFPNSDRIVYVRSNTGQPLSSPDFKDIREQSKCFEDFGAYTNERLNFGVGKPESLYGIRCTAGVLRAFGMQPALGRWLTQSDEQEGAPPVAVISHSLWARSLAGNPQVIGQTLRLDGRDTTIVGVMPREFEFPSPWYSGHDYELWRPLILSGSGSRGGHWLLGVARLKQGVSIAAADAEIKAIGVRLAAAYPDTNSRKPFLVRSLWDELLLETASRMKILFGAVCLLLLVACTNVASMLLARGSQRQGEFGVRLALGLSRGRLARLLLTESLLLGLVASAAGVGIAFWGAAAFRHLIPPTLIIEARRAAIRVDGSVLLFSVGLALLTAVLSGLIPAFSAARTPVVQALSSAGRAQIGTRLRHRFLRQMLAVQIGTALLLANGSILLFSSYLNVFKSNQALNTDQVLSAEISLGAQVSEPVDRLRFWDQLTDRVGALPGVQSVGLTSKLPLKGGNNSDFLVDGQTYDPKARHPWVERSWVTPGYFRAMGLTVLKGRVPERTDLGEKSIRVAINRAMADLYWGGKDPIGRRIRPNDPQPSYTAEVIGVIEDVRQWGAEEKTNPEIYFPCALDSRRSSYLVVRTGTDSKVLVPAIRNELAALDSDVALAEVRTMKVVLESVVSDRRMSTALINLFMGLTLLLAASGIYGTLSYELCQRRREIGVRIAVGALRRNILHFVVRKSAVWLAGGLIAGMALTGGLSFLLRSLVFELSPLDPLSLLTAVGLVLAVASLAFAVPTWRATNVEPIEALKCE